MRTLDAICCPKRSENGHAHWHILWPVDAQTILRLQILGAGDKAHDERIHHIASDWAVTDATGDECVAAIFGVLGASYSEPVEFLTEESFDDYCPDDRRSVRPTA